MKKLWLLVLAIGVALGASQYVLAEDEDENEKAAEPAAKTEALPKDLSPLVTVSFSGYEQLTKDLTWLGKVIDMPQLPALVEQGVKEATDGKGLTGLDPKRPWGFVLKVDKAGTMVREAFLPVTDLKELLPALKKVVGPAKDIGEGVFQIKQGGQTLYVKEQGGWALISDNRAALADFPADPSEMLGGLQKHYNLGVRANIKNLPDAWRQRVLFSLSLLSQAAMRGGPGGSEEASALQARAVQQSIQQLSTMMNELDTLIIGVTLDEQTSGASLEYMAKALPGTKAAAQFATMKDAETRFDGFAVAGSVIQAATSSTMSEAQKTQAKANLASVEKIATDEIQKQNLGEDEVKTLKQVIADLAAVVRKTVDEGKVDMAGSLLVGPQQMTLIAAATVADGAKLNAALKQVLAQVNKDLPDVGKLIKIDAEEYESVKFHTAAVPLALLGKDEHLAKLVGDQVDVVLGVADNAVYLGVGRDAMKTVKEAIDKSKGQGKTIPPLRVAVSPLPVFKMVAAVGEPHEKPIAEQFAKLLESAPGKDKLTVTASGIPHGVRVRIELEEGVLKVLGMIPKMRGKAMEVRDGAARAPRINKVPAAKKDAPTQPKEEEEESAVER